MHHHHTTLELKSLDAEGRFAGYASVFSVIDRQQDIILPGAFAKSLRARGHEVKLLWQHQMGEPVGIITKLFEDERGLYVEGRLLLTLQKAREAFELMQAQVVKGLSIGYTPVKFSHDPDSGVRRISEVDLWEISIVTFPANENAGVTVVKRYAGIEQSEPDDYDFRAEKQSGQLIALCDAIERASAVLE